jgi:hypothetical protein
MLNPTCIVSASAERHEGGQLDAARAKATEAVAVGQEGKTVLLEVSYLNVLISYVNELLKIERELSRDLVKREEADSDEELKETFMWCTLVYPKTEEKIKSLEEKLSNWE